MLDPLQTTRLRPPAADPLEGGTYVLRPGDTLDGLAELFGFTDPHSYAELRRRNPALAAGKSAPGSLVLLPATARPPAPPFETNWTRGFGRSVGGQNRYNAAIEAAARRFDDLDPLVLKSVLAQESNFHPNPNHSGAYRGVAQLGRREAEWAGLRVGRGADERLDPAKAVPAAGAVLMRKAELLRAGFDRYGTPAGDDYWRFVAAAYNGGEGTILLAMRYAYGSARPAEVRWSDLVGPPDGDARRSPLYRALAYVIGRDHWRATPAAKYREVSAYARDVLLRARQ